MPIVIHTEEAFEYIRNNWIQKNVAELAKDLGTSKPTVIRWAIWLGIDLWKARKIRTKQRQLQQVHFYYADILLKEFKMFKRKVIILIELNGKNPFVSNDQYRDCFLSNMTAEEAAEFLTK